MVGVSRLVAPTSYVPATKSGYLGPPELAMLLPLRLARPKMLDHACCMLLSAPRRASDSQSGRIDELHIPEQRKSRWEG